MVELSLGFAVLRDYSKQCPSLEILSLPGSELFVLQRLIDSADCRLYFNHVLSPLLCIGSGKWLRQRDR